MENLNTIAISGRLTKDPETKKTTNGYDITNISLANTIYIGSDHTNFIDVVFFGKHAITAGQYLKKGTMVEITGKIKQERWEDKEGKKRSKIIIMADKFYFVEKKGNTQDTEQEQNPFDADVPF